MFDSYGDAYWMVDMEMDCSRTKDGWFEVKGFSNGGRFPIRVCFFFILFYRAMEGICPLFSFYFAVDGAESNINQGDCTGTAIPDTIANRPPFSSYNHVGHCGFVNVFLFGSPRCTINLFPPS